MNITREISPDREVTITIEVPVEEAGPKFAKALEDFRENANVPGFRPGKAPLNFIRQRYGKAIFADTAEDLSREYLKQALEQEKVESAGPINIDLKEFGDDKPLRVIATFPLQPEVQLTHYKGLRVLVNEADISDSDIDEHIEILRRKRAHMHSIDDPAPANAILSVKAREVDQSGLQLLGRKDEEVQFEFGIDKLGVGADEQLLGIRSGESRLIKVRPEPGSLSRINTGHHIISPAESAGHSNKADEFRYLKVEAVRVEVPHLPEVDAEFARTVNPNYSTVDDLRKGIRESLNGYVSSMTRQMLERGLINRLIEDNPFPVARSLIEFIITNYMHEQKVPPEKQAKFIEDNFPFTERDYRWVLLRDEIARREGITVSDDEVEQELQRIAELTGEAIDQIEKRFDAGDGRSELRSRMFERRVIDFLTTNAEVEKRRMGLQEFSRSGSAD